jgi:hypothetical protein
LCLVFNRRGVHIFFLGKLSLSWTPSNRLAYAQSGSDTGWKPMLH